MHEHEADRLKNILDAIEPFARAAAMGVLTKESVKKADMSAVTALVGTAGYCAQHMAQSNVSWSNWEMLAKAWNYGGGHGRDE